MTLVLLRMVLLLPERVLAFRQFTEPSSEALSWLCRLPVLSSWGCQFYCCDARWGFAEWDSRVPSPPDPEDDTLSGRGSGSYD